MVFANLISISRTMERTSHINLSFVNLARWLISVTILLLLAAPCPYKWQKHTQQFVEKALIPEHKKIFNNDRNIEVARLLPEFCTKYRSEAQKALYLKRSWSDFDPQAYYLYGEDQNHETSFKGKALQAVADSWCKIQVRIHTTSEETKLQDEIMAGFEQAIISSIDFPESIVQARTNHVFDQGMSLEKISLSITGLAVLPAPERLYPGPGLIKLPEGVARVNVSPSLQEEHPESVRGKDTSLPHEEKTERNFDHIIQRVAKSYDVDPALVRAIIMAESSYNPRAVSKRGAKGLMQLMPKTAEYLGVEDSFNPEHNIDGGVRYFKELLGQFKGDVKLALAAYNAGSRRVKEYKGIPPFKATQLYVKKVFEYQQQYKQ